jgi:hypothetical protein
MNIAIAIPTIEGREESLQRTIEAYRETVEGSEHRVTLTLAKDMPTWGAGLAECMRSIADIPDTHVVHFTNDDIVPEPGWLEAGLEVIEKGMMPAALIETDGQIAYGHPPTPDMSDWKPSRTSTIPMIKVQWWDHIAPMLETQYWSDDYISLKLRMHGIETVARLGYRFRHFHENVGRGAGMTQDERMDYDLKMFQRWQMTGKLPTPEEMHGR